jgi:hypothetical protein
MRFVATGAMVNDVVQDIDLLNLIQQATSAISSSSLLAAVKLASIEMWSPPAASSSTPNTVAVRWTPTNYVGAPDKVISDTTLGTAFAAHIMSRPPSTSVAGQWLANVGQPIMFLTGPEGTIVDATITFVLANGQPTQAMPLTIAGATVGDVFLAALDYSGSKVLAPVSYASF